MKTLNISDELYLKITKTLNNTRNSKNSITHELGSQQIDLGTSLSELKHPSAVTELLSAEKALQSNIELLNDVLRAIAHTNKPPKESQYKLSGFFRVVTGRTGPLWDDI